MNVVFICEIWHNVFCNIEYLLLCPQNCYRPLWSGFFINFSRLMSKVVGVAAVDFDGDGWVDVLTVEESSRLFTGHVHWHTEDGVGGMNRYYYIMQTFCRLARLFFTDLFYNLLYNWLTFWPVDLHQYLGSDEGLQAETSANYII